MYCGVEVEVRAMWVQCETLEVGNVLQTPHNPDMAQSRQTLPTAPLQAHSTPSHPLTPDEHQFLMQRKANYQFFSLSILLSFYLFSMYMLVLNFCQCRPRQRESKRERNLKGVRSEEEKENAERKRKGNAITSTT